MSRRAIRLLNLRGLRTRPLRTSLVVIAVGSAVALVVGVLIAQHSLERSMRQFSEALGGPATLRIEGAVDHGGLDASVLPKVAAVDGVEAAVPMVVAITQAVDEDGDVLLLPILGVDCSVEAVAGDIACTPELLAALNGGPAISPVLRDRVGPRGELRTDLRVLPLEGAPVVEQLRDINGGLVALFDLATAQREFVRPGGLDVIHVVPAPGVDLTELRRGLVAAVGPNNLVSDSSSSPVDASAYADLVLPFMFLISLIALLIGGQLVRNTMELSLEERRRELATAAALGRTPRGLVAGILSEAMAIGALGGVVGLALGALVASAFVSALSDQVARATGLRIPLAVTPLAFGVGVVVGIGVCVASSLVAAMRASKRELASELSERGRYEPNRQRTRAWAIALPSITAVTFGASWIAQRDGSLETWQPPVLLAGMLVSFVVSFQINWVVVVPALRLLRGRRGFATGAGRVALDNLLSMPKRTAAIAAAIAAPAIMAVVLSSIVPGIGAGAERLAREGYAGRVYVSTLGSNNTSSIDAKTPPSIERRIAALPHVDRIEHWYVGAVDHPSLGGLVELDGVDGMVPGYGVHRGSDGSTALAAGQAMVGPRLARDLDLDVGDRIAVPGRYGTVELTVGGVWSAPSGIGRSITTTAEVMRTITGPRPPDRLQVVPTAGTTPEELADELRAAGIDRRLVILDPSELAVDYRDEFTEIASPFWAMQRGILFVAVVATASTLLLSAIQRRRDSGLLAALGMGPRALARTMVVETLLLGIVATAVGAASAQLPLLSFTWASEVSTGLVIPYRPQLGGIAAAGISAIVVALIGAAIPAIRVGRADPIAALREA
ncbi:MAG TPA: FtsX-like permease family protein [Acidimicrobiales bacterium]|nr:FtsX-like permease family protein [Acidimicrobiales bacterium]